MGRKYKGIEYYIGKEPRSERLNINKEFFTLSIPSINYFKIYQESKLEAIEKIAEGIIQRISS